MISINDFTTYFNNYVNRIPEITKVAFVSTDDEVTDIIKETSGIFMVVAFPSVFSQGNIDCMEDVNSSFLLVLDPVNEKGLTSETKIEAFNNTQQIIKAVRTEMLKDKADYSGECNMMHRLNTEDINIDPVSYYRGSIGWSMVFEIEAL